MKRGDIYWVEFPGGAGRAQAGRRPAIVAQAASATATLPTVLLIPLTSQLDALRFPGTVLVERDGTNGLRQHSVALGFQLTAIGHHLGRNRRDPRSAVSLKCYRQLTSCLSADTV